MQGKRVMAKSVAAVMVLCLCISAAQASSHDGMTSLSNPWNPAIMGAEKALDRSITVTTTTPHAGAFDGFSSWSAFADYDSGKTNDKRQGGFDNYFNSYTVGADALYNNSTLWGFLGNFNDAKGHSSAGARDAIETWAYTLYMSQPVNDWMFWGSSFSYSTAGNKINSAGEIDSDSYVLAPYVTVMTQMDKLTLSLSPSYVLGYQDVDYPGVGGGDSALMGKMLLMGRATYAVTEKFSVSANLNYNQVLHNHALDTEFDNDHRWFTTGVKLGYKFTSSLSGSLGYSTELDSNFDSDIWTVGLCYAF